MNEREREKALRKLCKLSNASQYAACSMWHAARGKCHPHAGGNISLAFRLSLQHYVTQIMLPNRRSVVIACEQRLKAINAFGQPNSLTSFRFD